jgi:dipeptidyl aminopeptidase/acylaminoacyl peptidase
LRMAYATEREPMALVVVDTATGARSRFEEALRLHHPTIAPDGSAVVVLSEREGGINLWRLNLVDGRIAGTPVRLTDHRGKCSWPRYSPDGRWIAYCRTVGAQRDIWLVPSAGGASVRVTRSTSVEHGPDWSPDGASLAFIAEHGRQFEVRVAPFRDGGVGASRRIIEDRWPILRIAWLADGQHLAIIRPEKGDRQDVWVVEASGLSPPARLTNGAMATVISADRASGRLVILGLWGDRSPSLRSLSYPEGRLARLPDSLRATTEWDLAYFDIAAQGRLWALIETRIQGDIWLLEAREHHF